MKSNEDTEIIRDSAKFCPSRPEATWHCKNALIMWKNRNEGLKKKRKVMEETSMFKVLCWFFKQILIQSILLNVFLFLQMEKSSSEEQIQDLHPGPFDSERMFSNTFAVLSSCPLTPLSVLTNTRVLEQFSHQTGRRR